jgi:hypothetical protein
VVIFRQNQHAASAVNLTFPSFRGEASSGFQIQNRTGIMDFLLHLLIPTFAGERAAI